MATNIEEYINEFSPEVKKLLQQIRETIQNTAPEATEAIKYGMPTFVLNGNLIHFAAFKNHIGIYPLPKTIEKFKNELTQYKQGKGSIQLPLDKPLPLKLIAEMVKYRIIENNEKAKNKK